MSKQITVYNIIDQLEDLKKGIDIKEDRHRLRDIQTMVCEEFGGWDQVLTTEQVVSIIEQAFILGQNNPKRD